MYKSVPTPINCSTAVLATQENKQKNQDIVLYPNPAKTFFEIQNLNDIKTIEVYDAEGKLVVSPINKNFVTISSLSNGVYWVQIEDLKGNKFVKKLIKKD